MSTEECRKKQKDFKKPKLRLKKKQREIERKV